MSHLHTLNNRSLLSLCLRSVENGDSLLLIENGVYGAIQPHVAEIPAGVAVYALQNDLDARGLSTRTAENVEVITDTGFVRLCCEHDKVINWF